MGLNNYLYLLLSEINFSVEKYVDFKFIKPGQVTVAELLRFMELHGSPELIDYGLWKIMAFSLILN